MSLTRRPKADAASPPDAEGLAPFANSSVLRRILDAVPTRVTYLDNSRRYRFANREFYAFTGLTPEQVIGRTVTQVLGRHTSAVTRPFVEATREGRSTRYAGWRDYPTGGRRYIDSVFAPVLRENGRMDGYFVLVRDLTETRLREEELASRNRQLEEILDVTPARVCVTDLERRYVYVNREFCRFAGKQPEEIIGLTSEQLVGPDVTASLERFVKAAQAGRTVFRKGWVGYQSNGQRYINYVFAPKRALDGKVEGTVVFMTDATELKRREEELAQRSEQLEAILTGIGDGVSIVDLDGRLVLSNRGFLDMFGFPEELAKPGTPVEAFVRHRADSAIRFAHEPDDAPVETLTAARALGPRSGLDSTEELLRSDGRWLEVRRRRLPDGTVVSTYTDVTARREAEGARRAQRDALRRAERMEATATLLAGVGHEINNPLAIIAAQALMLADDAVGTPLAARADAIRVAAQRCGRIVHTLMRSARRRPLRQEPVDLAQAVHQAIDLVGESLRAANIDVAVEITTGLPAIEGDPDQFAHLVSNLLSNALDAFESDNAARPRRLILMLRRERGKLELRVIDNGPGIPSHMRARIFDSFFTTKPEGRGTGVGLALCRTVVAAHGGRIAVEETPGGGATFVVRLPLGGAARNANGGHERVEPGDA